MRKLFVFLMLVLLSVTALPQTNAITSGTYVDQDLYTLSSDGRKIVTGKHVKFTFTLDSLGVVLLSPVIDLSAFAGTDFYTYPITFRFQTNRVSTANDTSVTCIRLLGLGRSATDTLVADTLRDWGGNGAGTVTNKQTRGTDSLGVLTLNGKYFDQVRVALQGIRRDTGTSYLDLYIRRTGY